MYISSKRRLRGLLLAALLLSASAWAQSPPKPYAEIDPNAVTYSGPGRTAADDLPGEKIRVGMLAAITGPRKAEGEALIHAAQMAIEDDNADTLPDGRRLVLVRRDENGLWGRASSEIVQMVFDDQVVAIVTSEDGGAAHLAEQVGNKIGVPILSLSTDPTTTEINLPWIFRIGPTDATQARLFARSIYHDRGLHRVLLITATDHDGRMGAEEFLKAARGLGAPLPIRIGVGQQLNNAAEIAEQIPEAEALVLWTGPEIATRVVAKVREAGASLPVYLCRKAAQGSFEELRSSACRTCSDKPVGFWTVASREANTAARKTFADRYQKQFGSAPTLASAQAYDAVRVLAAALRRSGPNRARLRDALADVTEFPGVSGTISFDHAGNDTTQAALVRVY